jgi:hypothetical protein
MGLLAEHDHPRRVGIERLAFVVDVPAAPEKQAFHQVRIAFRRQPWRGLDHARGDTRKFKPVDPPELQHRQAPPRPSGGLFARRLQM